MADPERLTDESAWAMTPQLDERGFDPHYGVEDLRGYVLGASLLAELKSGQEQSPELTLPDEEHLDGLGLDAEAFVAGMGGWIERMDAAGASIATRTESDATRANDKERFASWYAKLEEIRARPERGEIRIPGVPNRRTIQPRPQRRRVVPFREVAGDEKTDKLIAEREKELEDARRRRMQDPWYLMMKRKMARGLGRR